jgi:UDP-glucose 4-epimerase
MADTYLITGGAGFIGSHIAEMLVAEGQRVVIYDNLASGHLHNLAGFRDAVDFVEADVRDTAALAAAMVGVDYVFHEAAMVSVFESVEKPALCHEVNLTGTLNVCQAARDAGVKRLVMAGTAATYGNNPTLPKREDMMPEPESPYGLTKVAGEYYLQVFAKLYGLETAILRYFNVYGPRQDPSSPYSGVISKFTDVVRAGQTPLIFGDGLQTRDFVFVKDVARANLLAMRSPKVGHGEACNIGTGRSVSLLDLLAALSTIVGRAITPTFQPARAGDVQHSLPDITRAHELLGYAPEYDLDTGLRALFASLA